MNNQTKQQLKSFLNFSSNPQDIGLAIVEPKSRMPDERFWRKLDNNILYHPIDSPKSADDLIKKLKQAQKQDKTLIVELKVDPYPTVINLLKEISQLGRFNLKDAKGYPIKTIDARPGSIIVVAKRDFIENKISYPNFYNLFGSAFSLN